jgi:hypothetical protein
MGAMDLSTQRALVEHRRFIHAQWERLLRLDRGNTALARPEALVHLLATTLDEIYTALPAATTRRRPSRQPVPDCPCGLNPLLDYFAAGRQALRETLVLIQSRQPNLTALERDEAMACIDQILNRIARREILTFCGVCQLRAGATQRDHDEASSATGRLSFPSVRSS